MFYLHKGHYIWPGELPEPLRGLPLKQVERQGKTAGFAAPATVQLYRSIRALGVVVQPPSEDPSWEWCGMFTPMEHQRRTVASILTHKRSFVLDDPGTGKTFSALWGIDVMFRRGGVSRVLLVAPKSIVYGVWQDALFLHTDWNVGVLTEKTRERKIQMAKDPRFNVLLVNPQSLHTIAPYLDVDGVVVDEFTAFKNEDSRQTKALTAILERQRPWTVLMSGTPAPQGPQDAFYPIKLVNPRANRMTSRYWQELTQRKLGKYKWVPRSSAKQTLIEWLQPGVRTSRSEAIDLPTIQTIVRKYQLMKGQFHALQTLKENAKAAMEDGDLHVKDQRILLGKMLQMLTGQVLTKDPKTKEDVLLHTPNDSWLEAVEEVVAERSDPVLVFVPYRAAAATLSAYLKCPVVTGNTPQEVRQEVYRKINAKEVDAVVAVAATMSHGLTLTGATCVLWALPPASVEQYQQANARVYRKGQTKPVDIIHLVGHTFVQVLFRRVEDKLELQQAVLDALESI